MKDELRELLGRLRENGQVSRVVGELERRVQKDLKAGDAASRVYVPLSSRLHGGQEIEGEILMIAHYLFLCRYSVP